MLVGFLRLIIDSYNQNNSKPRESKIKMPKNRMFMAVKTCQTFKINHSTNGMKCSFVSTSE